MTDISREAIEAMAEKLEKLSPNSGFCALLDPAVDALRALLDRAEAAEARRAEANNQWRLDYNELATKLAKAREALKEIERLDRIKGGCTSEDAWDIGGPLAIRARAALKEIGE